MKHESLPVDLLGTIGCRYRDAQGIVWTVYEEYGFLPEQVVVIKTSRDLTVEQLRAFVASAELVIDGLPEIELTITSHEIKAKPRKLNMTLDMRSQCGWLQMMTHGITIWPCEARSGDPLGDDWATELVGGWGLSLCPLHKDGGPQRAEALAGLAKVK